MRRVWTTLIAGASLLAAAIPTSRADEPVGLIFDTDICGDVDDVLALGMIHALESRGECKLLAVTVSVDNPKAAPFVDLVNTFYGRGQVPVGVVGEGGAKEDGKYLPMVDQLDDGKPRYPHDLTTAPPATAVLRKALAARPDKSVVVAQVGFSTNLARLLETPGDEYSPLTGAELVRAKVKFLSLMAGSFQPIDGNAHYIEYNVIKDVPSCASLVEKWPTEMVFSGFEIGIALPYPATSIERDYGYVKHHPLAESYILYNPPPHNRPTWDLTSVLYAVHPDRGYFDVSRPVTVTIEKDGFSKHVDDANGRSRYLILRDEAQKARVLEALVQLSSQPPDHREGARQ
ncbi:nucleoside hydrolase [Planctomyces sp. SH-PL62]|uniref:nucleoside hydrolase n=1 Tax=Planctomyces sp. SH-PL62 TaxID=1636152 RepID=UPI00078B9080|nr:nucleoside hydrolase [Planctomyces sp. SH-PL62]AMV39736.1 Inosine-uridine preferring nucleoside hydrolase [Planctomyces sp. SH-PL62]